MIKVNFPNGITLDISDSVSFIYEIYQQIYTNTSNYHKLFIKGTENELPLNTKFDKNIHSVLFAIPNTVYNNKNICIGINVFTYNLELYTGATSSELDKSYSIEIKYIYNGTLYSEFISEYFEQCINKSPYELKDVKNIVEYNFDLNNVIYTCDQVDTNGYFNMHKFFCMNLDNKKIIKCSNDCWYQKIYITIIELKKIISTEDYDKLNFIFYDKEYIQ